MSILQRSTSAQAPAGSRPPSERLRVITAGRVGNMEARLGTSGFDVVTAAETEDALIDAVSVDEPDAIVVEADLCDSLEHVRDLAPDAVLIVVGDHTPAGALGRVERGMSGTAMAGLLHALVAEGVGAAVVWGLVPTFGAGGALHVPHGVGVSLLSAKADLIRAHLANALRDHAELVTTASTVLVTVSASLVVAMSAPSMHERPERIRVAAPIVEHAAPHPVVAVSPATGTPVHAPSAKEGEPGDRRGPNRGRSRDHGRHVGEDADDQGEVGDDQGEDESADDQGENSDEQGANENANDQGENSDDQGANENASDEQGANENANDQGAGGSDDSQGAGGNSQD